MRILSLINQKGGVGKTTTVANLAAALAERGFRIAMVDLDPQSHLTMHFGLEPGGSKPDVYEILTEEAKFSDAAVEVQPNLHLAPACIDLAGAEIELVATVGREQLLADRLAGEPLSYDYVLIDCPPSLSLLTLNALAATDEVLIPLQPHFLALQGLGKLLETVALVRRRVNPRLVVGGIILCMYESNTRLAGEVTEDVRSFLTGQNDPDTPWADARLYESRIRRNVKLAECPSFGESIFRYAPGCPGATDYEALAAEFLAVHGHGGDRGTEESPTRGPEIVVDPVAAESESASIMGEPVEPAAAAPGEAPQETWVAPPVQPAAAAADEPDINFGEHLEPAAPPQPAGGGEPAKPSQDAPV